VDVQEIERLHAEQVGALAGGRTHVGGAEVVDPQLRGDRDLVPVHVARGKPLGEPVTDDRLVAVDPGGVEVAVAERASAVATGSGSSIPIVPRPTDGRCMPAFRTDRRKTDRLDDRAPLPGSDFLVGVDRRPPADAHEVVEVVDLIGGLTGELGRARRCGRRTNAESIPALSAASTSDSLSPTKIAVSAPRSSRARSM